MQREMFEKARASSYMTEETKYESFAESRVPFNMSTATDNGLLMSLLLGEEGEERPLD